MNQKNYMHKKLKMNTQHNPYFMELFGDALKIALQTF
jgi:hypothetical protein